MKKILILLAVLGVLTACGPASESSLFKKSVDNNIQDSEQTEKTDEDDVEAVEDEDVDSADDEVIDDKKEENDVPEKKKEETETKGEDKKTNTLTKVKKKGSSSAEGMNEIKTYSGFISSEDDEDEITLYTDADEEDGEIMWDDGNEFLLEIKSADGEYYTLFDGRVSLGYIYFDVADIDGKMYVLVKNISTASLDTDVFTVKDGVWYETNELDLNDLKNSDINVFYSSAPGY